MKLLKWILIVVLINCSCNNSSIKLFTVEGKIKNYANKKILLISFENNETTIILDSTTTDQKGNFSLQTIYHNNELLAVQPEESLPYWLVSDVENIDIKLDFENYKSFTSKGSPATEQLYDFINQLESKANLYKEKNKLIDSLSRPPVSDSLLSVRKTELRNMQWDMKQFCKLSIAKTKNPALKYFYIFYGLQTKALDENVVFKQLSVICDSFPEHQQLASLKNSLAVAVKSDAKLFLLESKAANFSIIDSSKKIINLDTYTGKYLLLNFWSSKNNLYRDQFKLLNEAYKIYKDKNFDILSISIDSSKQNWLYQVKRDSLQWKNVLDTAALKSKMAKDYYISSTPYNILIHPNKNIIAVDVKAENLKDKLKELIP
jgi:peroxiredoxin